jgi:hypothetical protein
MRCFQPSADSPRCYQQKGNLAGWIDLDQRAILQADISYHPGATVTQEGSAMPDNIDDLLPTAKQIQRQTALDEAEKADQYARRAAAAEAEKHALIERLSKPRA